MDSDSSITKDAENYNEENFTLNGIKSTYAESNNSLIIDDNDSVTSNQENELFTHFTKFTEEYNLKIKEAQEEYINLNSKYAFMSRKLSFLNQKLEDKKKILNELKLCTETNEVSFQTLNNLWLKESKVIKTTFDQVYNSLKNNYFVITNFPDTFRQTVDKIEKQYKNTFKFLMEAQNNSLSNGTQFWESVCQITSNTDKHRTQFEKKNYEYIFEYESILQNAKNIKEKSDETYQKIAVLKENLDAVEQNLNELKKVKEELTTKLLSTQQKENLLKEQNQKLKQATDQILSQEQQISKFEEAVKITKQKINETVNERSKLENLNKTKSDELESLIKERKIQEVELEKLKKEKTELSIKKETLQLSLGDDNIPFEELIRDISKKNESLISKIKILKKQDNELQQKLIGRQNLKRKENENKYIENIKGIDKQIDDLKKENSIITVSEKRVLGAIEKLKRGLNIFEQPLDKYSIDYLEQELIKNEKYLDSLECELIEKRHKVNESANIIKLKDDLISKIESLKEVEDDYNKIQNIDEVLKNTKNSVECIKQEQNYYGNEIKSIGDFENQISKLYENYFDKILECFDYFIRTNDLYAKLKNQINNEKTVSSLYETENLERKLNYPINKLAELMNISLTKINPNVNKMILIKSKETFLKVKTFTKDLAEIVEVTEKLTFCLFENLEVVFNKEWEKSLRKQKDGTPLLEKDSDN